jgi:virulence factor
VIGLGDIAQKAYLPVITARDDVALVFCTRDRDALRRLADRYRVAETAIHVDALLDRKLDAAFVHTATDSHKAIATKLLQANVPVYLDKPLAYSLDEARQLIDVAEERGQLLMVGFNRRFAPMYSQFQEQMKDHRLVIMEKNRLFLPDRARRFIFDDFIHVVDTLRLLLPGAIRNVYISSHRQDGRLYQVALHLESDGCTAIGVMNRDSGSVEETLEVMSPGNKWLVRGLNTTIHWANGEERHHHFRDWETTLYRRGFPQIIDHFLECVRGRVAPRQSARDALETHALCEQIVRKIEGIEEGEAIAHDH